MTRQSRTAPYKTVRPARPLRSSDSPSPFQGEGQGEGQRRGGGRIRPAPSVTRDPERLYTFARLSEENHQLRLHLIELEAALLNREAGALVYNLRAKYNLR